MNAEHDNSQPLRLPAPLPASSSITPAAVVLPDPNVDLEGWLTASLTALENRFESFMTADSIERSSRPNRFRGKPR